MRNLLSLRTLLAGLVLTSAVEPLQAQDRLLSDAAQISLLTVLPGDAAYAMYGHSAIRVYDPLRAYDQSFNYGTFTFDTWFLPKFVYGELDYYLSQYPYEWGSRSYEAEGRPVVAQVLNLNAAQREAVFRFLQANAREENRYYRYDFLFDNCSTRIRDLFEQTLGDALRFGGASPGTGHTFRELIDPYQPRLLDFGIDLLLGAPVDRPATSRETMFLPDGLMAGFDAARIDTGGAVVPLVARTDTVLHIEGYRRPGPAFPWARAALWLVFALGVLATYRDYRAGLAGGPAGRRALDVPLFAFAGVAGVLIVFLWFVSLHEVTAHNWNLLWAWPTHLAAAVGLWRRRPAGRWLRRYLAAAAVAALMAVLGWLAWPQHLPPLLLPVLLLFALRAGWLAWQGSRALHPASHA